VREGVDPQSAVRPAKDFRLAATVLDPLRRIGKGCADKPAWVRQHIRARRTDQIWAVEWQLDAR
jgi:hypothetical protein